MAVGQPTQGPKTDTSEKASDAHQPGVPIVSAAFALGWQMAELFAEELERASSPPGSGEETVGRLPGVGELSLEEKIGLRFAQIAHGLHRVAEAIPGDP